MKYRVVFYNEECEELVTSHVFDTEEEAEQDIEDAFDIGLDYVGFGPVMGARIDREED